ncbi:hypothetical protein ACVWYI_006248 [Bradyrhizobium sp. LB13.1]
MAFERCQARGLLGQDWPEHRPHAELLGAIAFQLGLHDGAFDHLDPDASVGNILRRHDRPAQVKSIGAVEIADRAGDRGEIRLRNLLADIGLVDRGDAIGGNRLGSADVHAAQHELRLGSAARVGLADCW